MSIALGAISGWVSCGFLSIYGGCHKQKRYSVAVKRADWIKPHVLELHSIRLHSQADREILPQQPRFANRFCFDRSAFSQENSAARRVIERWYGMRSAVAWSASPATRQRVQNRKRGPSRRLIRRTSVPAILARIVPAVDFRAHRHRYSALSKAGPFRRKGLMCDNIVKTERFRATGSTKVLPGRKDLWRHDPH